MIRLLVGVFASLLGIFIVVSAMTFLGRPSGLRPRVYWLFSSQHYKQAVMSLPTLRINWLMWNGMGMAGEALPWAIGWDMSYSIQMIRCHKQVRNSHRERLRVFPVLSSRCGV